MKRKFGVLFCALLCAFSIPAFSLDTTMDVLLGGYYNYANVFTGKARYQESVAGSLVSVDGDYNAVYHGGGGSLGFDFFFNPCPFGIYFRAGIMGIPGVERTAGGKTVKLDDTEINFNAFCDIGGVFGFDLNDCVSLCVAPAASFLIVNSEYTSFGSSSRATIDSLYGIGITADIYAKFRIKYFVAAVGCAASFYPLAIVSSADSSINYSTNIVDTMAFNLRPYVSIGVSFREQSASKITSGGK